MFRGFKSTPALAGVEPADKRMRSDAAKATPLIRALHVCRAILYTLKFGNLNGTRSGIE